MNASLSEQTIAVVKATVPALQAHGLDITRRMYERLFTNDAIRHLFNHSHQGADGPQPKALASAILAYAQNIENLTVLLPAVERIAQKHVSLQIMREHYPFVAEALLGAIADVLGDGATEDVLAAWGEAYWFLANILIGREEQIYEMIAQAPGGWSGWRNFRVAERVEESSTITSFILYPEDGQPVLKHRPGQYLSFWFDVPGHGSVMRNYSISNSANGLFYRITVKREPGGVASNWLHDNAQIGTIVRVGAPAGDFYLPENPARPVVLMSGGVGLTPLMSMLETITAEQASVPTLFVHGTLNGQTHAFANRVRMAAAEHEQVQTAIFYEKPYDADQAGVDYDHTGYISAEWVASHTPGTDADYYLCGPKAFLSHCIDILDRNGVPSNQVHYEFFGPADELKAA